MNENGQLLAAGNIWTRADAEAALARGASAVVVGQAAIANPDRVKRISDPTSDVRRPPLTIAELRERGLNPTFAANMRNWKGFVADGLLAV